MKIATAQEMQSIDRRAIQGLKIPGLDLMERAGRAVARVVQETLGTVAGRKVVAVCGSGNNGGDGFVVARVLKERGADAVVLLLAPRDALTGDAAANYRRALRAGVPIREAPDSNGLQEIAGLLSDADVVIDGVLGTGISGDVRGVAKEAILAINRYARTVVAVDAPSGLDGNTGQTLGCCVEAAATVTFGLPKRGHFLMPGRAKVGRLAVADIGFPDTAVAEEGIQVECLDADSARALVPPRAPDAHKWDCGHVVLVSGSVGMTGAAALASGAALRTGAGLTTVMESSGTDPLGNTPCRQRRATND